MRIAIISLVCLLIGCYCNSEKELRTPLKEFNSTQCTDYCIQDYDGFYDRTNCLERCKGRSDIKEMR